MESGYYGKACNIPYLDNSETIGYLKANPVLTQIYVNHYGLLRTRLALKNGYRVIGKCLTLPGEMSGLGWKLDGTRKRLSSGFTIGPLLLPLVLTISFQRQLLEPPYNTGHRGDH